ncbi:MgtC/SapB family protein [Nitratireductor mangrovi]|uniref:MgtC/SapB family protein n=1 Tax=Nitratireductor mangrovi TaxID=2599600 RepID=A0A5B8L0Z0_9HYPH|nr:MgtC/SapB family protein [Nitratireductor mangrovi]QDZ01350.1 MgtC/SapB family protein [Nitratireductor mangrovi]
MDPLLARLGLALAIGLLVGLERGWREREAPDHSRTAGIRTYGLSGLLGGIFAALAQASGAIMLLVSGLIVFTAVFAWFKAREAAHDNDYSVTGVVAAIAVFALGALAVAGDYMVAAAGGTALAVLLASRAVLHDLLRRLTWAELRSALILAVMTAIVLPMLPDHTIDPWNGLNPYQIWFFTVLMAAISYLGYVATRLLGSSRGLLVSSLAGAVVSSTAVTVALARTARTQGDCLARAGAAALAAMVSILRVCGVVLIIEPRVLMTVALPALAAATVFAASGLLLLRSGWQTGDEGPATRNPFDLIPLLAFSLMFAIVSTVTASVSGRFGEVGLLATTGLSGMFDVDVAVLSALRLAGQEVSREMAGFAVLAAVASNAVGRWSLSVFAGPPRFWLPGAGITCAAAMAGYLALFVQAS